MGSSKPAFTYIKTKTVDNAQRWLKNRYYMTEAIEKKMIY